MTTSQCLTDGQSSCNQDGKRQRFRGNPSKQSKVILKLESVPESIKTTSIKIIDNVDNEVRKNLLNYREGRKHVLLVVELCEKSIGHL